MTEKTILDDIEKSCLENNLIYTTEFNIVEHTEFSSQELFYKASMREQDLHIKVDSYLFSHLHDDWEKLSLKLNRNSDTLNHLIQPLLQIIYRNDSVFSKAFITKTPVDLRCFALLGIPPNFVNRISFIKHPRFSHLMPMLHDDCPSVPKFTELVRNFFGKKITIQASHYRWEMRPPDEHLQLSHKKQNILGKNILLGAWRKIYRPHIMITVSCDIYTDYLDFLPEADYFIMMKELMIFYFKTDITAQLQLIPHAPTVPEWCLSDQSSQRLGRTMWLKQKNTQRCEAGIYACCS